MRYILVGILFVCVGCDSRLQVDCQELRLNDKGLTVYRYRVFSGTCVTHHPNGNIDELMHWQEGVQNGVRAEYYSDGTLKAKYAVENGLANGHYQSYYPNEQLEYEGRIQTGEKQGEWKHWNQQGKLIEVTQWDNGTLTDIQEFSSSGV